MIMNSTSSYCVYEQPNVMIVYLISESHISIKNMRIWESGFQLRIEPTSGLRLTSRAVSEKFFEPLDRVICLGFLMTFRLGYILPRRCLLWYCILGKTDIQTSLTQPRWGSGDRHTVTASYNIIEESTRIIGCSDNRTIQRPLSVKQLQNLQRGSQCNRCLHSCALGAKTSAFYSHWALC